MALSDGWNAFQRAGWVFAGAMVVWAIGGLIVLGIVSAIFGGWGKLTDANGYRGLTGASFSFSTFVVGLVGAILFALIQAQFVRVALTVTRGHRPTFAEFFRFEDAGPVVVLALIIGVVVGLLRAIPVLGGLATLVVEFFLYFAYYLLLDRKVQPVDAIRGSFDLVQRNLGQTLIFYVLAILNEVVWRTQTTDMWVNFKVFGIMPLTLVFALAQTPLLLRYEVKREAPNPARR